MDFNHRVKDAVILSIIDKPDFKTNEILEISEEYYSQKQMEFAKFISSYYICSLGDAFSLMMAFRGSMRSHAEHGNEGVAHGNEGVAHGNEGVAHGNEGVAHGNEGVAHGNEGVAHGNEGAAHGNEGAAHGNEGAAHGNEGVSSSHALRGNLPASKIELSPKQTQALSFLKKQKVGLLFGDTGSGKTEIYMKQFEEMLVLGKRSIFLMPEISLTPQMGQRLEEHFGESMVMWHSKLTPKQKKIALEKIHSGEAKIVAGPRSALFLPIHDLGLIVVDEEHDDSYKSSSRPRYNARDLAIYLGKLHGVNVLLGSATPSLTSYVKFPHIRLKGGHFSSNKTFVYERSVETLSPLIMNSLEKTLRAKEQSIVFLPTRANFKYLICQDCGHTYECVFCSVGLSVHQKSRALKCHYCNYMQAIPQSCCECQSPNLTSSRLGTAEAVKNISEVLENANVEQFDRDVITTSSKLKKALKRFNDGETDILVGTQMLSKGHDYHGVTLAVVMGMDNMLNMGDYRAREKALSSLIQVSGRSGRKKDALVLVQSFNEPFFRTFVEKYEDFLEEEKEYRKELYPPYKKLCRILFSHKNGLKAQDEMHRMQDTLMAFKDVEIVGYGKCGIERVANKYRFEILLRADKSSAIIRAINASKVPLAEIDMDPIEFG